MWPGYPLLYPRTSNPNHYLDAKGIFSSYPFKEFTPTSSGEILPVAPILGFVGVKLEQSQKENMKRRVAERERDERETESFSSTCDVQVLRSISSWSGSLSKETSIYSAYLDVIDESEKFIYIEN